MRNLTLFICLATGLIIHTNAVAENYVFYNEQALAKISDTGEVSQLDLGIWDSEREEYVINPELKEKITALWYYSHGNAPSQSEVKIIEDYAGCDKSLFVKSSYGDARGLHSYNLLPTQKSKLSEAAYRRTQAQGKRLLLAVLNKQKINANWRALLLKKSEITPTTIHNDRPRFIVISAADEMNEETKSIFIIALINSNGRYRISHQSISEGSASNSDGSAITDSLVGNLDLNNDNVDELFINRVGYEGYGTVLTQWNGKRWIEVAMNGGGC